MLVSLLADQAAAVQDLVLEVAAAGPEDIHLEE